MSNDPIGYLTVNVTFKIPVTDLAHYEAKTLEQAARNQQTWFEEDVNTLAEAVSFTSSDAKGFKFSVTWE